MRNICEDGEMRNVRWRNLIRKDKENLLWRIRKKGRRNREWGKILKEEKMK